MKNLVTADERQIISDSAELLRPIIDILNYAQGNTADWAIFCQKYTSLKNGVTTPGIVTNALAFYEKYTVNFVTEILHCINGNCSDISPKARNWLGLLSNDRLQDLDELVMQRMISSNTADETVSRFKRFADLLLSKIILSEAEEERVFSRHKSIHTKMRSKLDPSFVEKILFVKYNGNNVKIAPPEFLRMTLALMMNLRHLKMMINLYFHYQFWKLLFFLKFFFF